MARHGARPVRALTRLPARRRECDAVLGPHAPRLAVLDLFTARRESPSVTRRAGRRQQGGGRHRAGDGTGAADGSEWGFELTQGVTPVRPPGRSTVALWRHCGVEPCAVVGHSLGEVAAVEAAGLLTLAEAARVVYERSRRFGAVARRGAMAAVELTVAEAEAVVAGAGGALGVAAVNGRRASVISGAAGAVARVVGELERRGVMAREVRTGGVAGHSPLVAGSARGWRRGWRVCGGVRGGWRSSRRWRGARWEGAEVDGGYWGRG